MLGFMILDGITLAILIWLLVYQVKYHNRDLSGWLGAVIMAVAVFLAYIFRADTDPIVPALIFGFGFIIFLIGAYRLSLEATQKKGDQILEFQAKSLSDIIQVAAGRESLIELLNYSLDKFLEIVSLNSGAIHIYHKNREILVMGAYRGLNPINAKKLELLQPGQTAIGRVIQNKRVLIIRDLSVSPDYHFFGGRTEGYAFLAVAPVMVDDDCWGVITLLGRKKYYRGMLDINLLEQFGYKLGQALVLGRKNRQVTMAMNSLQNKIDFYNQVLRTIDRNLLEVDDPYRPVMDTLTNYPEKLFEGRAFVLLKISGNSAACIYGYRQAFQVAAEIDFSRHINADWLAYVVREREFFNFSIENVASLIPAGYFKHEVVSGYRYFLDQADSGVVIIDEPDTAELQKYRADLLLIGNLFGLAYFAEAANRRARTEVKSAAVYSDSQEKTAAELSSILAGIDDDAKTIRESLGQPASESNQDDFQLRLNNIQQAAATGLKTLNGLFDIGHPNQLIRSVIDREKLNVTFFPGPGLPGPKLANEDFEHLIGDLLKEAIQDNKKIKLKTSPANDSIALTIEGDTSAGFPSERLKAAARQAAIELNIVNQFTGRPADFESGQSKTDPEDPAPLSPKINVLAIENKDVIGALLADLFTRLGYNYQSVASGREGLAVIESGPMNGQPIEIAVIDMTLDDIPGLELSRKIKDIDERIYTVMISSWGVNLYKKTLADARVDAVLHKPFRLEQLKQVLPENKSKNAADF